LNIIILCCSWNQIIWFRAVRQQSKTI
jgi:hypothetical protein